MDFGLPGSSFAPRRRACVEGGTGQGIEPSAGVPVGVVGAGGVAADFAVDVVVVCQSAGSIVRPGDTIV